MSKELLIYLSYPLMDQSNEPAAIIQLKKDLPENWLLYHPINLVENQKELHSRLDYIPSLFVQERLSLLKQTEFSKDRTVLDFIRICERHPMPTNGPAVVMKNLAVLSISDLVIAFCDQPDYYTVGTEMLWAKLLDIPIIGVTDRFLVSPAFQFYTDVIIRNDLLLNEIVWRGSIISAKRQSLEKGECNENQL